MSAQTEPCHAGQWARDLLAARSGDVGARNRIIAMAQPYLYLLHIANVERRGAPAPGATGSDLVQDTLLFALQRFVRFQGQTPRDLLFWLRRILLFKLANFKRGARRRARWEVARRDAGWDRILAVKTLPPWEQIEHCESLTRMDRLLAKLSPEDEQIIRLREAQDLSFKEIGEVLGCSDAAAEKRFARAFRRLLLIIDPSDR
jgi:RNA polymerase sigma-70 factor (ECF subfamily)